MRARELRSRRHAARRLAAAAVADAAPCRKSGCRWRGRTAFWARTHRQSSATVPSSAASRPPPRSTPLPRSLSSTPQQSPPPRWGSVRGCGTPPVLRARPSSPRCPRRAVVAGLLGQDQHPCRGHGPAPHPGRRPRRARVYCAAAVAGGARRLTARVGDPPSPLTLRRPSSQDHRSLPGVEVGDIGAKLGYVTNDNVSGVPHHHHPPGHPHARPARAFSGCTTCAFRGRICSCATPRWPTTAATAGRRTTSWYTAP